jgi:hypothetical protein
MWRHCLGIGPTVAGNIKAMPLAMGVRLIHDTLICQINVHWTIFLFEWMYIELSFAFVGRRFLHSNTMTSWKRSPTKDISCNVATFSFLHGVVIQHLVSGTLYQTGYFLEFQKKAYIMLDNIYYPVIVWFCVLLSCTAKKSKNNCQIVWKVRTPRRFNRFQWCPLRCLSLYCYRFF